MNRQLLALAFAGATALTGVAAASATPPASTVGPVVVGWWSTANRNASVPALTPPDVGPHDLYVSGTNALPAQVAAPADAGPAAIAALQFRLPADTAATQLHLRLAGTHPPAVTVTACRALQSFDASYGGAWDDAPAYDCRQAGTARLGSDGQVVIDGVDRLRRGRDLGVVLVPGPLDRVVVAAPDARTLGLAASSGSATGGLPSGAGYAPPPTSGSGGAAGLQSGTGSATAGGLLANPGLPAAAAPPPAPATSGAGPAVAAPTPVAPASAAAVSRSRPWLTLLATGLLALLAFVPIAGFPRRTAAGAAVGARGVGRFRSERSGTVPDLA